jgi:hypothetical protein
MANKKVTALTELTSPASDDVLYIVDTSDTSGGASGTSKKVQLTNLPAGQKLLADMRTSEAVSKGDPLYISGYDSGQDRVEVGKADANVDADLPAVGLAADDYAINTNGQMVVSGLLGDVDTSTFSVGDILYIASGGGLTATKPTGSLKIQNVGKVAKSNATTGQIFVSAIQRTNDVPNLTTGKFFIGSASNSVESAYTMPTADGTSGQVLTTDGAGAVTFQTASGGGADKWRIFGSSNVGTTSNRYIGIRGNYVDVGTANIYTMALMPDNCELVSLTAMIGATTTATFTVYKNRTTSIFSTGLTSFAANTAQTFSPTGTSISQGDTVSIAVNGTANPGDVQIVMTFQAT